METPGQYRDKLMLANKECKRIDCSSSWEFSCISDVTAENKQSIKQLQQAKLATKLWSKMVCSFAIKSALYLLPKCRYLNCWKCSLFHLMNHGISHASYCLPVNADKFWSLAGKTLQLGIFLLICWEILFCNGFAVITTSGLAACTIICFQETAVTSCIIVNMSMCLCAVLYIHLHVPDFICHMNEIQPTELDIILTISVFLHQVPLQDTVEYKPQVSHTWGSSRRKRQH